MASVFSKVLAFFKPGAAPDENHAVRPTATRIDVEAEVPASIEPVSRQVAENEYEGDYGKLPDFVETAFYNWMAGQSAVNPVRDESFEHKIIEYLDVLEKSETGGANQIPRVPSVMVQLLKRTHEENVTGSELSQIITKDVVLVAAILNEVNSSFYKVNKKVTEISQALMLLGHNRLRMVLAKISFTPVFNDQLGNYTKVAATKLWEQSQQRSLACYLLAKQNEVDPFMAFLAGLMRDVGIIVALRVFDRSSSSGDLPTSDEFRSAFLLKSVALSSRIGQIWTLPVGVINAIKLQVPDKSAPVPDPMGQVLQRADFISKTCMLINAGLLAVDMDQLKATLTQPEMDCLSALLSGQVSVANIM